MTRPSVAPGLLAQLERTLGFTQPRLESVSGGDINQTYVVYARHGAAAASYFLKVNPDAPSGFFAAEAQGLDWLRAANGLRVPRVLGYSERGVDYPAWLALEILQPSAPQPNFDEKLGTGLAQLHASLRSGDRTPDNFIGTLPQINTSCSSWAEFYAEHRLRPMLRRALDAGRAPPAWTHRFERLFTALPAIVPDEPLARLHGDLWSGNVLAGPFGEPCLIDPAAYAGHREVDLAMMRLFGGFSERVFAAYAAVFPLAAGAPQRVPLYQLYPLLVHVNLFGGVYVDRVNATLARLP